MTSRTGTMLLCPCGHAPATVATCGKSPSLLRCRHCGLLARVKMPSAQELRRWYREQYWRSYQTEQVGPGRENVFAHALECLHHLTPHPGTLVDVGCGAGQLLALCRERLWRGIGFDPSSAAVAHAQRRGLEAYAQGWPPCPLDDETVDAVTFINVLDHLHDPFQALVEAWRILKPGGLLYIRVPNGPIHVSLRRLLSAARLDHLTVFHLFGFGRGAFLYHLPRLGFTVVAVQTAPPTQGDAYEETTRWTIGLKRFLKMTDRLAYRLLAGLGLDRRAWGLSIEVMARKVRSGGA